MINLIIIMMMIVLSIFFYIMGYKDGMIKKPLDTLYHLSKKLIKMLERGGRDAMKEEKT